RTPGGRPARGAGALRRAAALSVCRRRLQLQAARAGLPAAQEVKAMDIRDYLNRIKSDADAALKELGPPAPPSETLVKAGDNLQAAHDTGGTIRLEAGAVFAGNFVAKKAGTRLLGSGAELHGSAGPALFVPPGARDIQLQG